ncbi:preprotein translocase subunit SecA [Candidatus Falkowbacteria bacterium]|nr:preprotein translocase subunit SecA [Candidatus Falkowbacteria bacterium]
MNLLAKMWGDPNARYIKSLEPIVDQVNKLEEKYKALSDEDLKNATLDFKKRIGTAEPALVGDEKVLQKLDEIMPEAFAAIREAARRVIGQRHYDVQLLGGIVLHKGQIAEMKTGEGKTLVATLPLYLNALTGWGAQLVTVNDYLSRVGAGWMAPVFHALGLTTGVIIHERALVYDPEYIDESQFDDRLKHFRPVERRQAYHCDILYGTNNEFGFDYLKDNMVNRLEQMVQRPHYFAIVDEVDSILIDEARTPLIISAPAEESTDKYFQFAQLVERLTKDEDYNVDEKMRAVSLGESGIAKLEKWLGVENIYTSGGVSDVHHIEQALKAKELFLLDRDYVVREGEVIIVDEFTGRMMHGRRYSEGLHQAIEAKEGVEVQRESQTLATVTFQNYFRMYRKLAGMTGTAMTEAEEFHKIYKLETTVIPTNKPTVRKDLNDLIYRVEDGKYNAVIEEVKQRHAAGQPILIGTISIEKNERLVLAMEREGLRPQMLNAKNHQREAEIIAQAGKVGSITLATNMAGRGVDIMLGGTEPAKGTPEHDEWQIEHDKVVALGGLHVIGTERHEARRIDNQLRGRAGRQGDPGSSQFYVSTDDDLMRIFGGDRMKKLMVTLKLPDDMPIENKLISRSIESAQKKVEGNNFDLRKHIVEYDDVINKHRESIYRRRREILELVPAGNIELDQAATTEKVSSTKLSKTVLEMVELEIEQVVSFHTAAEQVSEWNLKEIEQVMLTIFPVKEGLPAELSKIAEEGSKLDKVKGRTAIIEHLVKMAEEAYAELVSNARGVGINWEVVEKDVLLRSIDALWIEHLEAMSSLRQGIGLRGYGQRDPLIEYKRESYQLYNELTNLIQKQVVYSIYKLGGVHQPIAGKSLAERATQYSAPVKEGEGEKVIVANNKDKAPDGSHIGRNDPCWCGSGLKYKKCHGK